MAAVGVVEAFEEYQCARLPKTLSPCRLAVARTFTWRPRRNDRPVTEPLIPNAYSRSVSGPHSVPPEIARPVSMRPVRTVNARVTFGNAAKSRRCGPFAAQSRDERAVFFARQNDSGGLSEVILGSVDDSLRPSEVTRDSAFRVTAVAQAHVGEVRAITP